jgi:hypothetical protein
MMMTVVFIMETLGATRERDVYEAMIKQVVFMKMQLLKGWSIKMFNKHKSSTRREKK